MDSGPAEGFEPVDKWQERRTGGKMGEFHLVYFGVYEIRKKDAYVFLDAEGRSIPLPGTPYMALRIRRVGPIVSVTPPRRGL